MIYIKNKESFLIIYEIDSSTSEMKLTPKKWEKCDQESRFYVLRSSACDNMSISDISNTYLQSAPVLSRSQYTVYNKEV